MSQEKPFKKSPISRPDLLIMVTVFFCLVIVWRLFSIQVLQHNYFLALASGQQKIYEDLVPERGRIYIEDRFTKNLYPLAINKRLTLVYAIPKQVQDINGVAEKLADILELPADELKEKLSKEDDLYEPLKHRVTDDKVEEIKNLDLAGIRFQPEDWRYYPDGEFAAHILGFVGFVEDEKKGRYGLEGYYNDLLAGKEGHLAMEKDAAGRLISMGEKSFQKATDGDDLVLTIDRFIQFKVETKIKEAVEKFGAQRGTVIIANPHTGEIIAMANFPTFNPNKYSEVEDANVFTNTAVYSLYEPGSAFKPVIMTAALDLGLVSPHTTVEDSGAIKVDEFTIRNFDGGASGTVTMTEILEKSINIGMVQIAQKMGRERVYEYVDNFGFNELSGIDLDTEASSELADYQQWSDADLATISFGQGISVTPIQLITATSAIANGGKLVQPHVVKKIVHSAGEEEVITSKETRQVISPAVAATTSAMMVSVVENGFGESAKVPGYKIAGKTGTAQVPNENGPGYDPSQKITSFIGFAPVEDPQFVMLVRLDNPGGDVWGASTAAPVFKEIAEEIFRYYQIPPSEEVK
ncbi:MAG: penicillin-binding protein 2 [Parcubacteria group bacterium]